MSRRTSGEANHLTLYSSSEDEGDQQQSPRGNIGSTSPGVARIERLAAPLSEAAMAPVRPPTLTPSPQRHPFDEDEFDVDSDAESQRTPARRGSLVQHSQGPHRIPFKTASNLAVALARRRSSIANVSTDPDAPSVGTSTAANNGPGNVAPDTRLNADAVDEKNEMNDAHIEGMLTIFDQCDSNHDGVLTILECREALRRFGIFISVHEIYTLFVELEAREESRSVSAIHGPHDEQPSKSKANHTSATDIASTVTSTSEHSRIRRNVVAIQDVVGITEGRKESFATKLLNATGIGGLLRLSLRDSDEAALRELRIAIDFVQFRNLMELWQRAARFRLFETRGDELQTHIEGRRRVQHLIPDSIGMWIWHVIVLFTSLYALCSPIALHMLSRPRAIRFLAITTPIDAFVTVVFVADMALKFVTVAVEIDAHRNRVIVDELPKIAEKYVKSIWFWFDLISLLPMRFFVLNGGDSQYGMTGSSIPAGVGAGCVQTCDTIGDVDHAIFVATILSHFRILKYLSHVTLFAESRLVPLNSTYIMLHMTAARGLIDLTRVLVLIHIFATIYCTFDEQSTNVKGDNQGGVADMYDHLEVPYVRGVYLVMYIFATVGYGDVTPANDAQRIFMMVLVVLGSLVNASLIGVLVTMVQRSDIVTTQRTTLVQLQSLLNYFDVPENLANEILQFENHILATDILRTYESIVCDLPSDLQRGIELSARLRVVSMLPYFSDVHNSAKLQLCNLLYGVTFLPEEYVIFFGEIGEEMYFLNHGFVDVVTGTQVYLTTLKPGNYFGEMAVMSESEIPRSASIKCISYCEFYVLSKDGFLDVISRYPRLKTAIQATAAARAAQIKGISGPATETQTAARSISTKESSQATHVAAEYSFDVQRATDGMPVPIIQMIERSAEQSCDQAPSIPSPTADASGHNRFSGNACDSLSSDVKAATNQLPEGPVALTSANLSTFGGRGTKESLSQTDNVSVSDWSVSGDKGRASPRRVVATAAVAPADSNPAALPSFAKATAETNTIAPESAPEQSVRVLTSSMRLARRKQRGASQGPRFVTPAVGGEENPFVAFPPTPMQPAGFQLASFQPSFLEATLGAGGIHGGSRKSTAGMGRLLGGEGSAGTEPRRSVMQPSFIELQSMHSAIPPAPHAHGLGIFDAGSAPHRVNVQPIAMNDEEAPALLKEILDELQHTAELVSELEERLGAVSSLH